MNVVFRAEEDEDLAAIAEVHRSAFPTDAEARLVDALRAADLLPGSFVAECEGAIVGHVAFSPVTVDGSECGGLGLAPVAVRPAYQRQGIGTSLIESSLAVCLICGYRFVVVLGEPGYYGRFGFQRADARGLRNEYGAGPEFMVLPLGGAALPAPGLVRYASPFAQLGEVSRPSG